MRPPPRPPRRATSATTPVKRWARGRLVWKLASGRVAGSGKAVPRDAPWARVGAAHWPILDDLELFHAHFFDTRHAMPRVQLKPALQT